MIFKNKGFTLIELMIAVLVVGVLLSVSIPKYRDYVLRSKIVEGTSTLMSLSIKLEQFYQDNRTYIGACTNNSIAPIPTNLKYFNIDCEVTEQGYLLKATSKSGDFIYQLDENENKLTLAVPEGWINIESCWIGKNNGQCVN